MSLMARLLQYLECPQYLRKYFFPVHDDLKLVGLLNPLDSPHHLRKEEISVYREGVVLEKGGQPFQHSSQNPHYTVTVFILNDNLRCMN